MAGPSGSTDAFLSNPTQTPAIAFADATTIVWNNVFGEVAYNVYRSDSGLSGTFSCLASHRSEPILDDFDEPSAGALLAYLVTTVNAGGEEGTLGFQTVAVVPTAERPNPNPCQ